MKITLLSLALCGLCATAFPQKVDNSTITSFDLNRYLGKWCEIARYDHSFERGLVGSTAMYTLRDDGKIKVLNSGYLNTLDGPYKESIGKAKARKNGKPKCIVCDTIKGKGVSYMEDVCVWHGKAPDEEQYRQALRELEV